MRLSQFLIARMEPILVEWEAFARTMIPPAQTMSARAIRDHAPQILRAIADDMASGQTELQRRAKSKGMAPAPRGETSAAAHGVVRQRVGFDLNALGAEYRALRATVLRLWMSELQTVDATVLEEVLRFNEGVDQALAESIDGYSEHVAQSRDTFLAVLGHDLRSPLGSLRACLHVLGTTEAPASRDKALRIGQRSITSIGEMVTDLLDYTRTRLGKGIEVIPQTGDFAALCHDTFEEVRAAHPTREMVARLPAELIACFDAPRMRQVLVNLLGNAVQHGDTGAAVTLSLAEEDGEVCAVVNNQGKPIPPDALQVIFDPLVQIPRESAAPHERPATSLGLGLYIAREIMTGHGGTIGVTSSADQGTSFSLRFRAHPAAEAAQAP